jgi:hypothetical protein
LRRRKAAGASGVHDDGNCRKHDPEPVKTMLADGNLTPRRLQTVGQKNVFFKNEPENLLKIKGRPEKRTQNEPKRT